MGGIKRVVRAVTVLGLVSLAGCAMDDPWKDVPGGPPRVAASFPPLYCFAKNVAGPDAAVVSLLTTVGPHDYQASRQEMLLLHRADLLLVNGLGLDDKIRDLGGRAGNRQLKVVRVGKAVPESQLLGRAEEQEDDGGHGPKGEHAHHGFYDPHVWLGIPEAILMVERIREALQQTDPAHAAGYDQRAKDYVGQLHKLHLFGRDLLARKKNRKIIATHDSLRYFARSFGLTVLDSIQPQPGIEADAGQMAKLIELCRREKVHVLAVEPQYPQATAKALQRQLQARGVRMERVEVDPLETADPPVGAAFYIDRMRANIVRLADKLE